MSLLNLVFKLCKVTRASLAHLLLICGLSVISAPCPTFSTRSLPSSSLVFKHQTFKHEFQWSLSFQLFLPKNLRFALLCGVLLCAYVACNSARASRGPLCRYLDGTLCITPTSLVLCSSNSSYLILSEFWYLSFQLSKFALNFQGSPYLCRSLRKCIQAEIRVIISVTLFVSLLSGVTVLCCLLFNVCKRFIHFVQFFSCLHWQGKSSYSIMSECGTPFAFYIVKKIKSFNQRIWCFQDSYEEFLLLKEFSQKGFLLCMDRRNIKMSIIFRYNLEPLPSRNYPFCIYLFICVCIHRCMPYICCTTYMLCACKCI